MELLTRVEIAPFDFRIEPQDKLLFVGSCFADSIGRRFCDELLQATVNPYGVMYNPASILHTVLRCADAPRVALLTLGTNHVYRLKETGEIVDNCKKRPQSLFNEERLSVEECFGYLRRAVDVLRERNADVRTVVTVSPIRYAKYGYHESRLSKATLLLAADRLVSCDSRCYYFPAYEIMNDELRGYRFYAPDMLHPSEQAVDHIYSLFAEATFSPATQEFLKEWHPIRAALNHRPFNAESTEYQAFRKQTEERFEALKRKYGIGQS